MCRYKCNVVRVHVADQPQHQPHRQHIPGPTTKHLLLTILPVVVSTSSSPSPETGAGLSGSDTDIVPRLSKPGLPTTTQGPVSLPKSILYLSKSDRLQCAVVSQLGLHQIPSLPVALDTNSRTSIHLVCKPHPRAELHAKLIN